jgi:hypothetical protein
MKKVNAIGLFPDVILGAAVAALPGAQLGMYWEKKE